MVFHALLPPINHLISTHIGVIMYLLHIVSTVSINHYISHIPISRTLLFFSIRDIVLLSPSHFLRPVSRGISYIHTLHLVQALYLVPFILSIHNISCIPISCGIYVYRYYILDGVKCAFSPPPPLIAGAVHIPILTGEKRASLGFTHRPIKVHWPTHYRAISKVFHYLVLYTYNQPRHLVPCHPFRFPSILHILYLVGVVTIEPKM